MADDSVQDRATPVDAAAPGPTAKYKRLSLADLDLIARMHQQGRTRADIAVAVGCAPSSVSEAIQRLATTPDLVRALMAASSHQSLASWKKATTKAARRGDHRPAKEWLEMAHPELRPATAASVGQGGITIVIGTPQAPLALPVFDTTIHGPARPPRTLDAAFDTQTLDVTTSPVLNDPATSAQSFSDDEPKPPDTPHLRTAPGDWGGSPPLPAAGTQAPAGRLTLEVAQDCTALHAPAPPCTTPDPPADAPLSPLRLVDRGETPSNH